MSRRFVREVGRASSEVFDKYSGVALLTPFDTHEYFIRIAENGHKCIIFRATSGLTSDGLLMVFSELFVQHFFRGGNTNF